MKVSTALIVAIVLATGILAIPKRTTKFRNLQKDSLLNKKSSNFLGITNGRRATAHAYPYNVFLEVFSPTTFWYCGGALITTTAVLTSARCADGITGIFIKLGAQDIDNDEESGQFEVDTTNVTLHPDYNSSQLINDIAIVHLPSAITLNASYVDVVPLPTADNDTYDDDEGLVTGWGVEEGGSVSMSEYLRYTSNPIITNDECEEYFDSVPSTQICMSGSGGHGICDCDAGDPLTVDGVLVGIASYYEANCTSGYPSVFTRISKYIDWIQENV